MELVRRDYWANGGWETFLSYEDPEQDILVGLLRLRKCSEEVFRPELTGGVSVVRELHVYGSVVPVAARDPNKFQHQGQLKSYLDLMSQMKLCRFQSVSLILISSISGFGTLLMEEAERIAREEHGAVKIAVISGVGTRDYYRKLGYSLDGPYMSKPIVQ